MRADADFMVYVAARWPYLVKEAVLLGARPDDAAEATTEALARCRRDWGRTSREENVDAVVRAELLLAVRRRPRTAEAGREQQAQELLVLAPPTLEELEHRERLNNRTTLRRAAWVAVPLLLVTVGAGAYLAATGDDAEPAAGDDVVENAAVSLEENPAPGVIWYADGQLHLDFQVLSVDGLMDMTRIGSGVVYGDDEGRVVYAADDGSREVLGHKDPDVPVAATDETGWAAWVETDGDKARIVIKEAATGNDVASSVVSPDARVIAVDGSSVYFVDVTGAHELVPGARPEIRPVTPAGLLDVRSRIRTYQLEEDTIEFVQSSFSVSYQASGVGAALSPDGNLVATRLPGSDDVELYDTRSGLAVPTGVPPGDHVLAVVPGSRLTVTYVVAPGSQTPDRELELRTCVIDTITECTVAARIPDQGGTPVLAR
jgi:hypothetical protein